jgi:predicted alpha/beta-fold hydrolase
MTSPVPFIGLEFEELEAALRRVKTRFPKRPLVMLGMSLGGNYLLRYLTSSNKSTELLENLQAFIAVCPPFDLKDAVHNMNPSYQKLFLLSYIRSLVEGHQQMAYWW